MRLLLDTHTWIWMNTNPGRLSGEALELIMSPSNERLLSVASCWEISIKYAGGKLPLPLPPETWLPSRLRGTRVRPLAITMNHAVRAGALPPLHADPFDRLMVAQAQVESLTLITADRRIQAYDVATVSATG
jgi:PIN domain nuclease of toxin-antitoxin system